MLFGRDKAKAKNKSVIAASGVAGRNGGRNPNIVIRQRGNEGGNGNGEGAGSARQPANGSGRNADGEIALHERIDQLEDRLEARGAGNGSGNAGNGSGDGPSGRSEGNGSQAPAPTPSPSPSASDRENRSAEQALRDFGAQAGMDADFVQRNLGISSRELLGRWMEHSVRETSGLNQIGGFGQVGFVSDARQNQRNLMVRAAIASSTGERLEGELRSVANERGRFGPSDLFRHVCRMHNVRYPDDPSRYGAFYSELRAVAPMVIQDFEAVASEAMNIRLISQLDEIQFAASEITAYVGMNGYLANALATPAVLDPLKKLPASREIEAGGINIFDLRATIDTLARRYPMDRKLWNTNPAGMFDDMPRKVAIAGRTAQNLLHVEKVMSNPRMSDGIPFWNERRGNVIGNASLTPEGVAKAQAKLTTAELPIRGTILIVNPNDQFAADQIVGQSNATRYSDVNPYSGRMRVVLFNGVEEGSFILAIDPTIRPFLLDLGMDDMPEPEIELVPTDQYDGFAMKVVWDRGSAYGDPRGAVLAFSGAIPDTLTNGEDSLYLAADAVLGQGA